MAPSVPKDQWDKPTQDATVSPEVCLDIVKGLNSPSGKGAQMFAKRKKKASSASCSHVFQSTAGLLVLIFERELRHAPRGQPPDTRCEYC